MAKSAKIALVTGANKGIGFEVARQLAQKGFGVFVGARNEKAGHAAANKIGPAAIFLKLDVSDPRSIHVAAKEFAQKADHLDVLVNNAGIIANGDEDILQTTPEQWHETMRTNALGPLLVSQAFVPLLKRAPRPRIINVSSGGGQLAAALPKFAVNSVCPGWVRTDMGGPNARESVEDAAIDLVWLAVDAPQNLTGKFFRHRKEIPW